METWTEQISYFIENIIKKKVHIAGNSLGGFLSAAVGSSRPDLVRSVVFLNAAPFWAFMSAVDKTKSDPYYERFPWNGVLPAPKVLLNFGSTYFDTLRTPKIVQQMLNTVYANSRALSDQLVKDIITSASHPGNNYLLCCKFISIRISFTKFKIVFTQ